MTGIPSRIGPLALAALLLLGCGKSAADLKESAQAALDAGDLGTAVEQADLAIQVAGTDRAMVWQVEQIRLRALAANGQGGQVVASLARLSGEYSAQLKSSLYVALAGQLRDGGDTSAAIDVLDAGNRAFPAESELFTAAIAELQQGQELDPAEIEKLKALGYL